MAKHVFTAAQQKALDAAVVEGLAIQHKFRPEPLYKLTGKGYMKSDGVAEIARLKEEAARAKGVAR
jgi:hypothetical protein